MRVIEFSPWKLAVLPVLIGLGIGFFAPRHDYHLFLTLYLGFCCTYLIATVDLFELQVRDPSPRLAALSVQLTLVAAQALIAMIPGFVIFGVGRFLRGLVLTQLPILSLKLGLN